MQSLILLNLILTILRLHNKISTFHLLDILHLDKVSDSLAGLKAFSYLKMSDNHRKFLPKESKEGEKDSQLSSKKKKENFVGNKAKKKGRKEGLITGA